MVSTQFGAILKEFENFFHCPLNPDENDSCLVQMGIGLSLQIELDRYGFILIGCRLGALLMGRYRNDLIRAALKSNYLTPPSTGVFGFSQKTNQLILFIKLNPQNLSPNQIVTQLPAFVTKAKQWADALTNGQIPTVTSSTVSSTKASGIFGLIS